MKTILFAIFAAFVTTLLTNIGVRAWQTRNVVWQYDAQRKAYADQQAKAAREEADRQAWLRTNKPMMVITTNCLTATMITNANVAMTISNNYICTTNYYYTTWFAVGNWMQYRAPEFHAGDKEFGFRSDGVMVFRIPPELKPTNTIQELKAKAYRGMTNLVH